MARLYSYRIPIDDGAAPNPYWGVCTLVICKPRIRQTAQVGDWIAATGAKHTRLADGSTRDLSGCLVYAMKVAEKMSMAAYDAHTHAHLQQKMPDWEHPDHRRRLGDSIYDFSEDPPKQRRGVHEAVNASTDLGGKFALLSTEFYYFGSSAILLPADLQPIAEVWQGHRVRLNEPLVAAFESWLSGIPYAPGSVIGEPTLNLFENEACSRWCATHRAEDDEHDSEVLTSLGC